MRSKDNLVTVITV